MKKILIYNKSQNKVVTSNGALADTFISRLIGLIGQREMPKDYCLIIKPCNQVHMMNMRFSIDVVYLDVNSVVIDIDYGLKPWSIGKKKTQAKSVVECHAGFVREHIEIGDQLVIDD